MVNPAIGKSATVLPLTERKNIFRLSSAPDLLEAPRSRDRE